MTYSNEFLLTTHFKINYSIYNGKEQKKSLSSCVLEEVRVRLVLVCDKGELAGGGG